MAKKSNLLNMVLCLFIVCFASSAILAYVYTITEKPIADAKTEAENNAISLVVPSFDNIPSEESFENKATGKISTVYPIKKNGQLIAYAIKVLTSKGFGGNVEVMVGINTDASIFNTLVISHSETPGLGDKMDPKKSRFSEQFIGKSPTSFKISVKKDGGDVDAITAATISSRAYCDAINLAYKVFNDIQSNSQVDIVSGATTDQKNNEYGKE